MTVKTTNKIMIFSCNSLFRRSTNWPNSGPKWHDDCEFCSF